MKSSAEGLVALLGQFDGPVPSTRLAELMHVTPRSIKNYVARINKDCPGMIEASSRGYCLSRRCSDSGCVRRHSVPETYVERCQYVIHQLFVEHNESLDIWRLCDELALSYSSVKNLLSKMNQEYRGLRVTFRTHGDRVFLEGTERDKRRFLTRAIYRESSGCFVDRKAMKRLFDARVVDAIDMTLKEIVGSSKLSLSEFGYANLLLHLSIAVDRMNSGNNLGNVRAEGLSETSRALIDALQKRLGVMFNEAESVAIDEQVRMNFPSGPMHERERLIQDIGERNYRITEQIIRAINSRYHLNLNEETLLLPLALHIKNLIIRCEREAILPNPFLETMQASLPVLFDCAVFAAERLQAEFGVLIPKDEVAYIAMHIGADIERQNREDGKLACVLLCPDYHRSREEMAAHLVNKFSAQIMLIASCGYEDEIPDRPFDVLLTTVSPVGSYPETILIPPLKAALDMGEIVGRLQDIADRKKLRVAAAGFRRFFQPSSLIFLTGADERRDGIIYHLSRLLTDRGCVTQEYFEDVMRRERAASTAFRDVAIPHAMNMNAKHTGIALAIAPQGVEWGSSRVHAVLLVAISEQDLPHFQELYEALILLFSQDSFMRHLKTCLTFEEFSELLLSFVE